LLRSGAKPATTPLVEPGPGSAKAASNRLPSTVRRAPTSKCTTSTDSQMAALIIQAPWNNDPPRVVRGLRTTPLGLWGTPSFNSRPIWKVEIRSAFAASLGRSLGLGGGGDGGCGFGACLESRGLTSNQLRISPASKPSLQRQYPGWWTHVPPLQVTV